MGISCYFPKKCSAPPSKPFPLSFQKGNVFASVFGVGQFKHGKLSACTNYGKVSELRYYKLQSQDQKYLDKVVEDTGKLEIGFSPIRQQPIR